MSFDNQIERLLDASLIELSTVKPSEFAEKYRVMTSDVSAFSGEFSYDKTPYLKEIVDCLSEESPARIISVMKGAQVGFTTGVIENGIGWIIKENAGNILYTVGHESLVGKQMKRVDNMIDTSGLRDFIRSNALKANNRSTGDTARAKEFSGGSLQLISATNSNPFRNFSVQYGFIDDFEAVKDSSADGNIRRVIEQRFASYYSKMKLFYISTPKTKTGSNIEPVYEMGDKRKYHIPCPCCGSLIALEWSTPSKIVDGGMAGITWKLDDKGKLIKKSVGYVCQDCDGFFTDSGKHEFNLDGKWMPTAEPIEEGFRSYHLSALYAPVGMYDWAHYVGQYLEANPPDQKRNESLHQTFMNLCLGETYEAIGESIKANELQKNIRDYSIGLIPESLSIKDGNGKIVLITCGSDLNGVEDDARLDYEIVAHSESGSTYSIMHGSIGTFIPRENKLINKIEREKWTYQHGHANSVWREFEEILNTVFKTDTGRSMKVFATGLDCGYMKNHAYQFLDTTNNNVYGVKGKDMEKYIAMDKDSKTFHPSKERSNLYLVETNFTKDLLNDLMQLRFNPDLHDSQPSGFMNFPTPEDGKYLYTNYFSHFEAEHKVIDKDTMFRWVKKNDTVQNHLFDCRLYANVTKDIVVSMICKALKITNGGWVDYVNTVLGRS